LSIVATIALIVVAFLIIYPAVNVQVPGRGSDDDDTYNIGAKALMTGSYPYSERTYLGNQLHPLPGSFVLAAPFLLLGTSAWQNVFWIILFFVAVSVSIRDPRAALELAWLVLTVSPTVVHQVLTGTAHVSNTIYVLLGLWYLLRARHKTVAAVGWGVALASRANFMLLVPLGFAALRQRRGFGVAAAAASVTLLTIALLTVPFYLHDPVDFGPLDAADRITRFNAIVPYGGELIVVAALGVAILLSTRRLTDACLYGSCAIVQAVPVVVGTALSTMQGRGVDLAYATYGTFATWFVIMAVVFLEKEEHQADGCLWSYPSDAATARPDSRGGADVRLLG
jgi:hypothetical protein